MSLPSGGGGAEMLAVGSCKGRITVEARLEAAICSGDALTDQVAGVEQAAFL